MKHIIRKILKEQDEIINVPDLDFFDGDWEELLEFTRGRKFRVRGNLGLSNICPETLGNLVSVDGNLILWDCKNFSSLGSLEYVGGRLNLFNCENLTSLDNLVYVGDALVLHGCDRIKSLGKLTYVGAHFDLRHTPLAQMYSEKQIRDMIKVNGYIYIDDSWRY
jgi:hypothetical protein